MLKKIVYSLLIISCVSFALPNANGKEANGEKKESKSPITNGGKKLSLQEIIDIVIKRNLALQSAKYDVEMSDTNYRASQKKYALSLNAEAGYTKTEVPETLADPAIGTKVWRYDTSVSAAKTFSTGTAISAGVKELLSDGNDQFGRPTSHTPALFTSIQQELLKNAFGYADKRQEKILKNAAQMQRAAIINQLSGLVAGALVDYWTVTVRKSSVDTARMALESNIKVRNIITKNAKYGLSNNFEINQYNALVASSEAGLESEEQSYREAVRTLLRSVNMTPETQITGLAELTDSLPMLDRDAAVKAGFKKRVDYKNSLMEIENAKMAYEIEKNAVLPSLTVSLGISTQGDDKNMGKAFSQAAGNDNPSMEVRAKISFPINDTETEVNNRNALYKLKQSEINIQNMKIEVRDDIINRLDQVESRHKRLMRTRTARKEAEIYYDKILRRFEQRKEDSTAMKIATDNMVQMRFQELDLLVQYNISLLLFDLSKNEIFERYNVDVEKYLKDI